jgi:hypothetical protein
MSQLRLNAGRAAQLIVFITLLSCYGYFFPRWADPNQNSRLDMVVAVVDDGTFQIDKYVHNTVDYAKVGEHYYSDKAPGTAFLGIPIYAGLKLFLDLPIVDNLTVKLGGNKAFQATLREDGSGILKQKVRFALAQVVITFLVAALPSALLGLLMYRLLAHFASGVWLRAVLVLGYGLLTPAFAYAGAFYGHQLSTALLFGAFYLAFQMGELVTKQPVNGSTNRQVGEPMRQAVRNQKPGTLRLLIVGLLLGYSVVTEYPTLLVAGILYLYVLYILYRLGQWARISWVTLGGAIVAIGWMIYNTAVFGSPLELGYSHSELWQDQHHTGFMSLTLPHGEAMWGITFGIFRGLFILSPWLLLAVPGFWLWWRSGQRRVELLVAVASALAMLLFNASSIMWWGGFAVGPRYLLPALPFMVLPVAFVFREWGSQTWLKGTTAVLSGWSLVATWGLTLADQAFPSDTIRNPLEEYAWPNWLAGNIARNVGTILGFQGIWSLTPLLVTLAMIGVGWWLLKRRITKSSLLEQSDRPDDQPGPILATDKYTETVP